MARPKKDNAQYFSHDNNMRNHRKIKAIRAKFGITGYGIWCMFLEFLTEVSENKFENKDIEMELLAGDFGVSVTETSDVLSFCIKLGLLKENEDGYLYSEGLNDRLASVYEKRNKAKKWAEEQKRTNGKFSSESVVSATETTDKSIKNTSQPAVSVTETPQSKVKESKVKESKVKESKVNKSKVLNISFDEFWDLYDYKVGKSNAEKNWVSLTDEERTKAIEHIPKYKAFQPDSQYRKHPERYLKLKSFNDELNFNQNGSSNIQSGKIFTLTKPGEFGKL